MALHTVRSERLFCEQLDYNFLFRWFLDLETDEASFDHSTFSRNRARLLEHEVAGEFFRAVVEQARGLNLLSDEHFTVDGTLVEAWASLKSFKRKDAGPSEPPDDPGNPTVNFRGERRSNATHQSTTDREAQLAKEGTGKEAKLCYSAHPLMENRNTILIDFQIFRSNRPMAMPSAAPRSRWSMSAWPAAAASPWAATRATTPTISSKPLPHAYGHSARGPQPGARRWLCARPAHDAPSWLRNQSVDSQARRSGLRLDEDHRRSAPHPLSRLRTGADARLPGGRRLQPDPNRQAQPGSRMNPRSSPVRRPPQRTKAAAGQS